MNTHWTFTAQDVVNVGTIVDTWGRIAVAFRRGDRVQIVRVKPSDDDVAAALDALHIHR